MRCSTVLENALKKHIPLCPDFQLYHKLLGQDAFERGVNLSETPPVELPAAQESKSQTIANRRLALAITIGRKSFETLVSRIEALYEELISSDSGTVDSRQSVAISSSRLKELLKSSMIVSQSEKHVLQQESIIGNMKLWGLLDMDDMKSTLFIEFGCGKAYLTAKLVDLYPDVTNIVLLDNKKFKLVADGGLREKDLKRIRCDIADFNPHKLPQIGRCTEWLAYGKHLCGSATDFTLRCCANFAKSGQKGAGSVGYAIATCCHHLCSWDQYVGKSFILSHGFSPEEFELMCYMCSWATCGHSSPAGMPKSESTEKPDDAIPRTCEPQEWRPYITMDRSHRMQVGAKCKEIIDQGRVAWSRDQGFFPKIVDYIDKQVSEENRLLLCRISDTSNH